MKKINLILTFLIFFFVGIFNVLAVEENKVTLDKVLDKYKEATYYKYLTENGVDVKITNNTTSFTIDYKGVGENNYQTVFTVNGDIISYTQETPPGIGEGFVEGFSILDLTTTIGVLNGYTLEEMERFLDQDDEILSQNTIGTNGFEYTSTTYEENSEDSHLSYTYLQSFKINMNNLKITIPEEDTDLPELTLKSATTDGVVLKGKYNDDFKKCEVYRQELNKVTAVKVGEMYCNGTFTDKDVKENDVFSYYINFEGSLKASNSVVAKINVPSVTTTEKKKDEKVSNPKTGVEDYILPGLMVFLIGTMMVLGIRNKDLFKRI